MDDARAGHARRVRSGDDGERLASYLDRWLAEIVASKLKPATLASYRSVVDCHLAPAIGAVRLRELTRPNVQDYYARLRAVGTGGRTVSKIHAVLHRALASAVNLGLLSSNPAALEADAPTYRAPEREPLTSEQTVRLLLEARADRLEALYVLAATTGARQGELFALRWGDVDLERATITIARALQDADARGRLTVGTPKTAASRRRFGLPSIAIDALRERKASEKAAGRGLSGDLVFADRNGGPLRRQNFLRRDFYPLLERAGLPRIHFHDIRHGAATALATMGTPVVVVAALLGHADPAVTLRTYQHAFEGAAGDAAQRLGDALSELLLKA